MALQRHMRIVDSNTDDLVSETGLKVAFATTNMKTVDQHFGSARTFAIYLVSLDKSHLLEAAQFGNIDQDEDSKLTAKIDMLQDCAAVYCQAIGSSAISQLVLRGIQPVKVSEGVEISRLIEALQEEMKQGPSAWLAKAIARYKTPDMRSFDSMPDEGWDE